MLNRQYGIAAPSPVVKVVHPEDSQPNERIHERNKLLPPRVANTARPPRFDRAVLDSGQRLSQFATRGSWRGKGPGRSRQESHSDICARGSTTACGHGPSRQPIEPAGPCSRTTHPPFILQHYRSPSPKLPLEPIRRRTPLDLTSKAPVSFPSLQPSPVPLPGRKCNAASALPSEASPAKALKSDARVQQVTQSATSIDVHIIKDESPTPDPIIPLRKLVKEACSFWRIPDNCRKSDPHHQDNRRAFAKAKVKEMSKLDLKRTKIFFREDGLVIEWCNIILFVLLDDCLNSSLRKSDVPIWNDTLLPEKPSSPSGIPPQASAGSSKKRKRSTPEIIDIDALPTSISNNKDRSSDLIDVEISACSTEQVQADQPQLETLQTQEQQRSPSLIPSPKKRKRNDKAPPEKHWAVGLSKEDVRKLGKGVQVAPSHLEFPTPSSSSRKPNTPTISPVQNYVDCVQETVVDVQSSPTRRRTLPTRIAKKNVHENRTSSEKERKGSTATPTPPSVVRSQRSKIPQDDLEVKPSLSAPSFSDNDDMYVDNEPTQPFMESGSNDDTMEEFAGHKSDDMAEEVVCKPSINNEAASSLVRDSQALYPMVPAETLPVEGVGEVECDEKRDEQEGNENAKQEGSVAGNAASRYQLQCIDRSCAEQDTIVVDSPEYDMAVKFLQRLVASSVLDFLCSMMVRKSFRFIELFVSDRTQLQMAYSNDALFSYRVHSTHPLSVSSTGISAPESSAPTIYQGRSTIVDRLCELGNYQFSLQGVQSKTVYYDLAALSREIIGGIDGPSPVNENAAVGCILATLHSEVINPNLEDPQSGHMLTLDQSFVLRQRTERDDDDRDKKQNIFGLVIILIQ